ncbi:hypothetical protein B0H14DRAFT_3462685 [Mycena olivaceomarginata]|nr:hypothetical protein B0H14DRAFT_3462685 [Mycena olivaceomarginata]
MSQPIYEGGPDGSPVFKGFTPLPLGNYTIWSQKYQGIVVDLADSKPTGDIQGYPSNNTNAQEWTLAPQGEGRG